MTFQPTFTEAEPARDAGMHATLPSYDARRLTNGQTTAQIVLDDKTYTLRITKAGKLILTK